MNQEIREMIRKRQLRHWQVAKQIGICETTLCRWLRDSLTKEKREMIISAIQKAEERYGNGK